MRKKYLEWILDLSVDVIIIIFSMKTLGVSLEVALLVTILMAVRKNIIFNRK